MELFPKLRTFIFIYKRILSSRKVFLKQQPLTVPPYWFTYYIEKLQVNITSVVSFVGKPCGLFARVS